VGTTFSSSPRLSATTGDIHLAAEQGFVVIGKRQQRRSSAPPPPVNFPARQTIIFVLRDRLGFCRY
jgi:hypothetical protein